MTTILLNNRIRRFFDNTYSLQHNDTSPAAALVPLARPFDPLRKRSQSVPRPGTMPKSYPEEFLARSSSYRRHDTEQSPLARPLDPSQKRSRSLPCLETPLEFHLTNTVQTQPGLRSLPITPPRQNTETSVGQEELRQLWEVSQVLTGRSGIARHRIDSILAQSNATEYRFCAQTFLERFGVVLGNIKWLDRILDPWRYLSEPLSNKNVAIEEKLGGQDVAREREEHQPESTRPSKIHDTIHRASSVPTPTRASKGLDEQRGTTFSGTLVKEKPSLDAERPTKSMEHGEQRTLSSVTDSPVSITIGEQTSAWEIQKPLMTIDKEPSIPRSFLNRLDPNELGEQDEVPISQVSGNEDLLCNTSTAPRRISGNTTQDLLTTLDKQSFVPRFVLRRLEPTELGDQDEVPGPDIFKNKDASYTGLPATDNQSVPSPEIQSNPKYSDYEAIMSQTSEGRAGTSQHENASGKSMMSSPSLSDYNYYIAALPAPPLDHGTILSQKITDTTKGTLVEPGNPVHHVENHEKQNIKAFSWKYSNPPLSRTPCRPSHQPLYRPKIHRFRSRQQRPGQRPRQRTRQLRLYLNQSCQPHQINQACYGTLGDTQQVKYLPSLQDPSSSAILPQISTDRPSIVSTGAPLFERIGMPEIEKLVYSFQNLKLDQGFRYTRPILSSLNQPPPIHETISLQPLTTISPPILNLQQVLPTMETTLRPFTNVSPWLLDSHQPVPAIKTKNIPMLQPLNATSRLAACNLSSSSTGKWSDHSLITIPNKPLIASASEKWSDHSLIIIPNTPSIASTSGKWSNHSLIIASSNSRREARK